MQGCENCADNVQTSQTDESHKMIAQINHTNQSHKSITQINHTRWMTSQLRMKITDDAFGCSRATQVHMDDLRLVNLNRILSKVCI